MPKRGLTRRRATADNALVISSGQTKATELMKLLDERPDKPILIRTRQKLLTKIEADLDNIYRNFTEIMEGKAAAQSGAMFDAIIAEMRALPSDADLQVRRNLSLAMLNLSDASKMQASRERVVCKMIDKLLIDTKETETTQNGENAGGVSGLFKGATFNVTTSAGVNRGLSAKQKPIDAEAMPA